MVQRGAIEPLIKLVQSQDVELQEFSAFTLGQLAHVINPNHLFSCVVPLVWYLLFGERNKASLLICFL